MPGVAKPPEVLVWSNSITKLWLVAGPLVNHIRQGIRSNSFQSARFPDCQTVLPKDWPCSCEVNAWAEGTKPAPRANSRKQRLSLFGISCGDMNTDGRHCSRGCFFTA